MRKIFYGLLAVFVLAGVCFATYTTLVHMNGKDELVVESSGKIDVLSGGELELSSGSIFDVFGTTQTADGGEVNLNDGATAGVVVASKTVVASAYRGVDSLAIKNLYIGDDSVGTAYQVTSDATELNQFDGWIQGFLDCDTDPDTIADTRITAESAFYGVCVDSAAGTVTITCEAGAMYVDTEGLSLKDVWFVGK